MSPDVIAIVDLDLGNRSVTNDIENVLRKIEYYHQGPITAFKIMYRDSEGVWDGSRKGLETVGVYSRAPDIVAGLPSPHADTATSGLTRLSSLISMALDYPKPNDPFMFSLRYT
jgi:hypothetical protein